jgi:hypothetical protein
MAMPDKKKKKNGKDSQHPSISELAQQTKTAQKELDYLRDLLFGDEKDADRRPEKPRTSK